MGFREGVLSDFEAADEWFRELREINRDLKNPPPQKRELEGARMLPGFGRGNSGAPPVRFTYYGHMSTASRTSGRRHGQVRTAEGISHIICSKRS